MYRTVFRERLDVLGKRMGEAAGATLYRRHPRACDRIADSCGGVARARSVARPRWHGLPQGLAADSARRLKTSGMLRPR
jgi:hypothetical protein